METWFPFFETFVKDDEEASALFRKIADYIYERIYKNENNLKMVSVLLTIQE